MDFYTFMQWQLSFLTWRDCMEIFFFSCMVYSLTKWLKKDTEKNLLPYFYGYCLITLCSYHLQLPTVTYCSFLFAPVVIMLFMLFHQETLQRNLIALKNISPPAHHPQDWLETVLRHMLKALNEKKSLLLLLEHTDSLSSYLEVAYSLDAHITEGTFHLLFEKELYDPMSMLWIKSDGTLRGINSVWKASWHPSHYSDSRAWIDDAIAYTTKTDAVIMQLNPEDHACTVAFNGTIHEKISVDQAAQLIKKHIEYPIQSQVKKGYEYGVTNKKDRVAQRAP